MINKKSQNDLSSQYSRVIDYIKQLAEGFSENSQQQIENSQQQIENSQEEMGGAQSTQIVGDQLESLEEIRKQLEQQRRQSAQPNMASKTFNLKRAQFQNIPEELPPIETPDMNLDQETEPVGAGMIFKDGADLKQWLEVRTPADAIEQLTNISGSQPMADPQEEGKLVDPLEVIKGGIQRFYDNTTDQERLRIAMRIFDILPNSVKKPEADQEQVILAPFEEKEAVAFVSNVNDIIKKIATTPSTKENKTYNLKKLAQAKTVENVILWGPTEKRIDPFLHQPVSDWSVVERNKGFGLVVDDVWNIDWESIWRGSIMDKYSQPYRNKNGEWVGGYIQKRFEVDKWIPEYNNMQLKPGQLRKARPPELGNLEARIEAMRNGIGVNKPVSISTGKEYTPASIGESKDEPFNWQKSKFDKISSVKKKVN